MSKFLKPLSVCQNTHFSQYNFALPPSIAASKLLLKLLPASKIGLSCRTREGSFLQETYSKFCCLDLISYILWILASALCRDPMSECKPKIIIKNICILLFNKKYTKLFTWQNIRDVSKLS